MLLIAAENHHIARRELQSSSLNGRWIRRGPARQVFACAGRVRNAAYRRLTGSSHPVGPKAGNGLGRGERPPHADLAALAAGIPIYESFTTARCGPISFSSGTCRAFATFTSTDRSQRPNSMLSHVKISRRLLLCHAALSATDECCFQDSMQFGPAFQNDIRLLIHHKTDD